MTKRMLSGLLMSGLLAGCTAPVQVAEQIALESTSKSNNIQATTVSTATVNAPKPAMTGKSVKAPDTGIGKGKTYGKPLTTSPFNAKAGAAEAAAATGTAFLEVAEAPETALRLIPMLDDESKLNAIKAQPATGALTWTVKAINGPQAIAQVRITLQAEANHAAPERSVPKDDRFAAPTPPPPPANAPMSFDKPAADILEAPTLKAGASSELTLSLKSEDGFKFLTENPTASRVSIKMTLLGEGGEPLKNEFGQPIQLTHSVTVL